MAYHLTYNSKVLVSMKKKSQKHSEQDVFVKGRCRRNVF